MTLVNHSLAGAVCGGGIAEEMRESLLDAERRLRSAFEALAPEDRNTPSGERADTFEKWCGIRSVGGFRPNAGFHSSGSAIDIDVDANPYIVTRTPTPQGVVFGGEAAGAHLQAVRLRATEVYDRAVRLFLTRNDQADVGVRKAVNGRRESTAEVYDRFAVVSNALRFYFSFAFRADHARVERVPQPLDPVPARSEDELLDALLKVIPEDGARPERRPRDEALQAITELAEDELTVSNTGAFRPKALYFQMLQDYELVRIPMVFGNPSPAPASTRNPARGFMSLRKELVTTLCDAAGMRWGACDFGPAESGDVMHFDLGRHATT